jgi:hypothetical protein
LIEQHLPSLTRKVLTGVIPQIDTCFVHVRCLRCRTPLGSCGTRIAENSSTIVRKPCQFVGCNWGQLTKRRRSYAKAGILNLNSLLGYRSSL